MVPVARRPTSRRALVEGFFDRVLRVRYCVQFLVNLDDFGLFVVIDDRLRQPGDVLLNAGHVAGSPVIAQLRQMVGDITHRNLLIFAFREELDDVTTALVLE